MECIKLPRVARNNLHQKLAKYLIITFCFKLAFFSAFDTIHYNWVKCWINCWRISISYHCINNFLIFTQAIFILLNLTALYTPSASFPSCLNLFLHLTNFTLLISLEVFKCFLKRQDFYCQISDSLCCILWKFLFLFNNHKGHILLYGYFLANAAHAGLVILGQWCLTSIIDLTYPPWSTY